MMAATREGVAMLLRKRSGERPALTMRPSLSLEAYWWTWCSSTRKVWGMMDRRLLHLIRLFGFTTEGTLVHEGDLLCEEFQLGSDGVKLQLQAFDDGDKDMLVHPVKLFIGKRGKICHVTPRFCMR